MLLNSIVRSGPVYSLLVYFLLSLPSVDGSFWDRWSDDICAGLSQAIEASDLTWCSQSQTYVPKDGSSGHPYWVPTTHWQSNNLEATPRSEATHHPGWEATPDTEPGWEATPDSEPADKALRSSKKKSFFRKKSDKGSREPKKASATTVITISRDGPAESSNRSPEGEKSWDFSYPGKSLVKLSSKPFKDYSESISTRIPTKLPRGAELVNLSSHGLPNLVATNGFIEGDGNCQYRALSYWYMGDQDYHADIREAVVKELETGVYDKSSEDKSFASRQKLSGVWGGEQTLAAAAKLYGNKIVVLSLDSPGYPFFATYGEGSLDADKPGLLFMDSHYELLFSRREK